MTLTADPTVPTPGQAVAVHAEVLNQGPDAITGYVELGLDVSADPSALVSTTGDCHTSYECDVLACDTISLTCWPGTAGASVQFTFPADASWTIWISAGACEVQYPNADDPVGNPCIDPEQDWARRTISVPPQPDYAPPTTSGCSTGGASDSWPVLAAWTACIVMRRRETSAVPAVAVAPADHC
jgi:hypothetical protein